MFDEPSTPDPSTARTAPASGKKKIRWGWHFLWFASVLAGNLFIGFLLLPAPSSEAFRVAKPGAPFFLTAALAGPWIFATRTFSGRFLTRIAVILADWIAVVVLAFALWSWL